MTDYPIDLSALAHHLPELEALWQNHDDTKLTYSAAIDAVSEKVGIDKKVLRKLVTARKTDKTEKALAESHELADVLEALRG